MTVDKITLGKAPFMNFGVTAKLEGYIASFDRFLAYAFEYFLSGHTSVLGNSQDVETARDYAHDVHDTVYSIWPEWITEG